MSESVTKAQHHGKSGVVYSFLSAEPAVLKDASLSPGQLIKALEEGLPAHELTDLQASFDIPTERFAPMLGISKATVQRQKRARGRLNPAVSDRVVRFARLLGFAVRVMGDLEEAKRWLNSPQFGLGDAIPLDYARTEVGAREVENLLGRIEFGVYS